MIITKLFLPGDFEDAFIYMGRLITITVERTIRIYNFNQIVEHIEDMFPDSRPVLSWIFNRNDWLSNTQFLSLIQNPKIKDAFISGFDEFSSKEFLEIDNANQFVQIENDLNIPGHVILDMLLYYQRLYIAADTGLYHVDIEWGHDSVILQEKPTKKFDARCISTSAKYGAINTSCGDNGLFSAIDDFGWSNSTFDKKMNKIANKSLRSVWSDYDLVNYSSSIRPSLLKSSVEKIERRGFAFEATILTEIGTEEIDLNYLIESIKKDYNISIDSIQYVYNSDKALFIHTTEGYFYSIGMKKIKDGRPEISYTRTYKGAGTHVLSMNPSKSGLVIETNDHVWLFSNKQWFPIVESEVLSIRTFMRSKRYKNIALITTEEGLFIANFFDPENIS